ncbi:hypothetical protein [Streptomyces hesseae]|uniref:DUF2147 domain-containing protein n=1 Tax=Streptomyces hesseae TaxID=3075519 RepID=A0ABU2SGH9_9ACTN|nr:hypothetical protein [Streptomyces sp. DSM 40473]MDT0448073.1 hypothetical protein [Streptomyces sp. DSM 40473]
MNITRVTRSAHHCRSALASFALGSVLALSLCATPAQGAAKPGKAAAARQCTVRSGDGEQAAEELGECSRTAFDRLFAQAPAGRMPHGPMRGRLLRCSACGQPAADRVLGLLAGAVWHGKVFHTDERGGHLLQVMGPDLRVVRGEVDYAVYPDDGREAIRVVYPRDMGGVVTDWIREVRPGVYAGVVTLTEEGLQPWRVADFVLYR